MPQPSGTTLAFYCGRGTLTDRAIRWVTRSRFSHVEILLDGPSLDGCTWRATVCGASPRDGGVRVTQITFRAEHWEIVTVPWAAPDAAHAAEALVGARYDWLGILLSQVIALRRGSRRRWFCSELVAAALGLPDPVTYAPGQLYDIVRWANGLISDNG